MRAETALQVSRQWAPRLAGILGLAHLARFRHPKGAGERLQADECGDNKCTLVCQSLAGAARARQPMQSRGLASLSGSSPARRFKFARCSHRIPAATMLARARRAAPLRPARERRLTGRAGGWGAKKKTNLALGALRCS